jgi:hypothetical protein
MMKHLTIFLICFALIGVGCNTRKQSVAIKTSDAKKIGTPERVRDVETVVQQSAAKVARLLQLAKALTAENADRTRVALLEVLGSNEGPNPTGVFMDFSDLTNRVKELKASVASDVKYTQQLETKVEKLEKDDPQRHRLESAGFWLTLAGALALVASVLAAKYIPFSLLHARMAALASLFTGLTLYSVAWYLPEVRLAIIVAAGAGLVSVCVWAVVWALRNRRWVVADAKAKGLEEVLVAKLAFDTRPDGHRDQFQAAAGRKRSTIRKVRVVPLAGYAIRQHTLTTVTGGGVMVRKALKQQPFRRDMVAQGAVGDCWLLGGVVATAVSIDPNFLDDILIPVTLPDGSDGVMMQLFEVTTRSIVQITMSLDTSTSYNNPHDDDIRVELLEKGWGFFRSGVADYAKINFGSGVEAFNAFGMTAKATAKTVAGINAARAAGQAVTAVTWQETKSLVGRHLYAVLDGDTFINPWDAKLDTPVTPEVLASDVAAVYCGWFPATRILQRPAAPTPAPAPAPAPPQHVALDLQYAPVVGGEVIDVHFLTNADNVHVSGVTWKTDLNLKPSESFKTGVAKEGDAFTFTGTRKDGGKPASKTVVVPPAAPAPQPPAPTPNTKKPAIVLYDDNTWAYAQS